MHATKKTPGYQPGAIQLSSHCAESASQHMGSRTTSASASALTATPHVPQQASHLAFASSEAGRPQGGPALVTTANNFVNFASSQVSDVQPKTTPKARQQRHQRHQARGVLRSFTGLKRVESCGACSVRPGGTVDVHRGGFSGLATCGSVWACPVCSAKIQHQRREELQQLVAWAQEQGYSVVFGTMTLRHNRDQTLRDLWDTLSVCHQRVAQDRAVRDLRKHLGFVGYVRAVEVTRGDAGWHPHIHSVYLLRGDATDAEIDELADTEFAVWRRTAMRGIVRYRRHYEVAGKMLPDKTSAYTIPIGAPVRRRYELKRVTAPQQAFSDYFAKTVYEETEAAGGRSAATAMAYEMAGSATKTARRASRTPFQILADLVAAGAGDLIASGEDVAHIEGDLRLWWEYESASYRRRALTWSRGLKKRAGIGEKSDEEIAEGAPDDEDAGPLFAIANWKRDIAPRPVLGSWLLAAIEDGGAAAGLDFCAKFDIETLHADHERAVADRQSMRRISIEAAERGRLNSDRGIDAFRAAHEQRVATGGDDWREKGRADFEEWSAKNDGIGADDAWRAAEAFERLGGRLSRAAWAGIYRKLASEIYF